MAVKTQKLSRDDVLKWLIHPAFNLETITLNNGDVPLVIGDSLVGRLAWNSSGSTWKILDDGDSITAASIICPIMTDDLLIANAAGDAAAAFPKCVILRRGPALVHADGIVYDADVVQATVNAAMLAQGIKLVTETGLQYTYDT